MLFIRQLGVSEAERPRALSMAVQPIIRICAIPARRLMDRILSFTVLHPAIPRSHLHILRVEALVRRRSIEHIGGILSECVVWLPIHSHAIPDRLR